MSCRKRHTVSLGQLSVGERRHLLEALEIQIRALQRVEALMKSGLVGTKLTQNDLFLVALGRPTLDALRRAGTAYLH